MKGVKAIRALRSPRFGWSSLSPPGRLGAALVVDSRNADVACGRPRGDSVGVRPRTCGARWGPAGS